MKPTILCHLQYIRREARSAVSVAPLTGPFSPPSVTRFCNDFVTTPSFVSSSNSGDGDSWMQSPHLFVELRLEEAT